MSESFLAVYQRLSAKYPDVLTLDDLAEILRRTSGRAIYLSFHRGDLPVTLRREGARLHALLVDAARYVATGEPQQQIHAPRPQKSKKPRAKTGRLQKAEEIARRGGGAN
jgi:uncharacterized protein YbjT (DUF2867 family)